ncbi:hypothetical protein GCM10009789_79510 [Kribbella sancticallisti]|uniref:Methyltransferase domain-containing protein n=1 Tax=Kribbella sancticallisti TaxID=460087 RepID=A0ABP4QJA1_9ACTN
MVDYDKRLHAVYAEGRQLAPEGLQDWIREFAASAPARRPLVVLDLGCGIGRFTPGLAEEFGGPVYGVEPSEQMRRQAIDDASHPDVTYGRLGRGDPAAGRFRRPGAAVPDPASLE